MDYKDPLDPFVQETTNVFLTCLVLVLLVIVVRYLLIERPWNWRRSSFKFGVSMAVTMTGLAIRFGWVALARFLENSGRSVAWMDFQILGTYSLNVIVPCLSTGIITWGLLCKIHTLTPLAWGRHAWMACIGVAAGMTAMIAWHPWSFF